MKFHSVNKPGADIEQLINRIKEQLNMQKDNISISQMFSSGLTLRRAAVLACLLGAAMPLAGFTVIFLTK